MAETPSTAFPVPKPPPPPLDNDSASAVDSLSSTRETSPIPPSLSLPSDDELKVEEARQAMLGKTVLSDGASADVVSVAPAVAAPMPASPTPEPATTSVPIKTAETAQPPVAPAAPNNQGTASDVRPPVPSAPAFMGNPLAQRIARRPAPTLAEQVLPTAPVTPSVPVATATSSITSTQSVPVVDPVSTATAPASSPNPALVPARPPLDMNMDMLSGANPAEPKRGRGWLVIGVLAGLLIVGGGTTLWLQSKGTIYVGSLQGLVGGFPRSPELALPLMREKMTDSYTVTGRLSLVKSASLPSIGTEDESQSVAEVSGSTQGSLKAGNWDASYNLQLATDYPVTTLQGRGLKIGDKRYLYLDTLSLLVSNNSWQTIAEDDWSATSLSIPFNALELNKILERASSGQYLGQNSLTVSGQDYSVNVYQYKVDAAYDYTDAKYEEGRLLVWVNRANGQIVEYQLDERLSNSGLGDFVFQSVWEIGLNDEVSDIVLPEGDKPVDGTVSGLAVELGFVKATQGVAANDLTTPLGRDAQRLADLMSIKEALLEYYAKQGTYPVATTVDKTSDGRVLKGALVPTYIDALPVDPQGGKNYYGYTSDGFSFKLTSIVEDAQSPGAKAGSGFNYQEIRN